MGFQLQFDFFLDLINVAFALFLLVASKRIFKIDDIKFLILIGHLMFIFCTNYVLFDPMYMGDQFTYLYKTFMIKGLGQFIHNNALSVNAAGYIFSYFPIPIINSLYSLSIINFIIFLFLYLLLKQKKIFTKGSEYFFLLFPSMAIYSSVALRDMINLVFMIYSFYYFFIAQKKIIAILFLLPLFLLKWQNGVILILAGFIYLVMNYKNLKFYHVILIIGTIAFALIFFNKLFSLKQINNLRLYFYFDENPDKISEYTYIASWSDLAKVTFVNFFRYIFEPYLWQVKSPLQLFQAVENAFVAILIISYYFRYKSRKYLLEKRTLLILFIFAMALYGLIIINPGTAARYRFTFVVCFIVFYGYFGEKGRAQAISSVPAEYLDKTPYIQQI
jgi:hypothetical protein